MVPFATTMPSDLVALRVEAPGWSCRLYGFDTCSDHAGNVSRLTKEMLDLAHKLWLGTLTKLRAGAK